MAAAASGRVETLVTWNEKDFNCKRRPPPTPGDIVDALHRAGVREFAARVRPDLA